MSAMKVIIVKEVPKLGKPGEVKSVADGYARNFLIPFGFAEPATESRLSAHLRVQAERAAREAKERARFEVLAEKLKGLTLRLTLKVGEQGQAFGSITAPDIAEELGRQGIALDRRWIELAEPIKATGEHTVTIKLPHQAIAVVKVATEAE